MRLSIFSVAGCVVRIWFAASASGQHTPQPEIRLRDVTEQAGIHFVHQNDPTPQKYMIEAVPGGVAAFDYNNDGLTDIFFTNGADARSLFKKADRYWNRLYRNDGAMRFSDVTADTGVKGAGYSMGAAAADFDNDGYVDLFVTGVNRSTLYRNLAGNRFEDVTELSDIASDRWAVAAGWFDYDNDGWLDLFVVNYLNWSPDRERSCGKHSIGLRIYCSPTYFDGLPNTLYRNLGNGRFEDVSETAGIVSHVGKGMSVAFGDYNSDGWMDVFVPNDTEPNFLFRNSGRGTFDEVGLSVGVALLDAGRAISSMGADFRDYNNDGLPDLNVTALDKQTFPVFRNLGDGSFEDATHASAVGALSVSRSGWCNGFVDLNNDGLKDLFTANSHVNDQIERLDAATYKQLNSVFINVGKGRFAEAAAFSNDSEAVPRAHRGCAFADFNNDGKMDVVVSALGDRAELWENVGSGEQHWIKVKLEGRKCNRDAIGATIAVQGQTNTMTTSVGYASSSHHAVHFGLGTTERIATLRIDWPGGRTQTLHNVEVDQTLRITEEN